MIGRPFLDFVPADQAVRDAAISTEALRSGVDTVGYTSRVHAKDGREVVLNANARIVRDAEGRVVGTTGISRDITGRQRADERLIEQAALLDAAHEAIMVKDLDDRIVYGTPGRRRPMAGVRPKRSAAGAASCCMSISYDSTAPTTPCWRRAAGKANCLSAAKRVAT